MSTPALDLSLLDHLNHLLTGLLVISPCSSIARESLQSIFHTMPLLCSEYSKSLPCPSKLEHVSNLTYQAFLPLWLHTFLPCPLLTLLFLVSSHWSPNLSWNTSSMLSSLVSFHVLFLLPASLFPSDQIRSDQSLSRVWLFATHE